MPSELPPGIDFRPIKRRDVKRAVAIVAANDQDDAAEAKRSYSEDRSEHFVLTMGKDIVGVTGFRFIDETDRAYWLSWTYLDPLHQDRDLGAVMVQEALSELSKRAARKVFVSTSDYVDARRGSVYRDLLEIFEYVGFAEELRHPNYYAPGESMIMLGLPLAENYMPVEDAPVDERPVVVSDYGPIDECDDAWVVDWGFTEAPTGSSVEDLQAIVEKLRHRNARVAFISAASDASRLHELAISAGFQYAGRMTDFHEDGVHEDHFRLDLA